MIDTLIERATLITMDPARRVISDGAVAIEGNRIVAVGPTSEVKAAHSVAKKTIDGYGKVVTPGMVDLHARSGGGMIKCIGEQLGATAWRDFLDDVAFRHTTPRWWYVDSQLHALERLRFGATTIFTQPGVSTPRMDDPKYVLANQRAFEDLGIRARIIVGPSRPPWPQTYVDQVDGQRVEKSVTFEQVIENCHSVLAGSQANPSPLVDYCTGLSRFGNKNPLDPVWKPEHEVYVRKQADALREMMERYGVGFWTHAYGNAVEYAFDSDLGLLGPNSVLSHLNGINERSVELLAETGTRAAHHPRIRRLYMYGEPVPIVEMIEAGIIVGLGSDGPQPDRAADPFLDMKAAMMLQRYRFKSQEVLPPGKVLEMASIDGYRALNLDHELGSLEPGKKADLIVIDALKPHLWPLSMPVHQVVYYATGADVEHVFVEGRQVIDGGKPTTIDQTALLEEAEEELERLMREPGLGLPELARVPERYWGVAR
ncbi:MAG: amidohydrolase family protein [Chloroflexi bacterium]|nr:amidohydrolase family protein [Chloroflexota bacterium]